MRSAMDIREHPNFDRLKNSVEAKAVKKDIIMIGSFLLFYTLLLCIPSRDTRDKIILWLIYFFGLIPFFLYQIYHFAEMFFHIDRYTFTEVTLDHPKQGYRGAMAFAVTLQSRSGQKIEEETSYIFSRGEPNFEDYVNRKALIGYNDKTQRVVVIKKLP